MAEIGNAETMHGEVERAIAQCSFWVDLLSFLPWVKARRDDALTEPFRRRDLDPPELSLSDYRVELRRFFKSRLETLNGERAGIGQWLEAFEEYRQQLGSLIDSIPQEFRPDREPALQAALDETEAVRGLLDRTLRRRLFHLAARYWEGRWILETDSLLDNGSKDGQSKQDCVQRWRRFAKLTPLSVSTFFLLPKLFDYFDRASWNGKPLTGVLDMLVCDEAGQTTPETGAPALHYARRALIVGDAHQIEPIWGIDSVLDHANARRAGLPEGFQTVSYDALRPSGGSLMALAQRASQWTDGGEPPGVMLREHWRCVPSVISYCNELVYRGRLQAKRPDCPSPLLPPMGWAHVRHPASKRGGSWMNVGQVSAIVDWIVRHRSFFEDTYGDLQHGLGILTPFRAQVRELGHALRQNGLHDVEAGTVHTFQGGEKSVMIFSPVYDRTSSRSFFFDRGPNMLNVAVSRAKESFLVFGDMEIFQPGGRRPSSVLADFLFREPSQEITDVNAVPEVCEGLTVERIDSLDGHRWQLRIAFETARKRLLIVSPYLTPSAVNDDRVPDLIRQARSRDVEVVVAYCRDLCPGGPRLREAKKLLSRAGAKVWSLDRVHNKTLAVDNQWIAEGSFNWLSALRDPDHRFQRFEASVVIRPPDSDQMIEDVWKTMRVKRAAARS